MRRCCTVLIGSVEKSEYYGTYFVFLQMTPVGHSLVGATIGAVFTSQLPSVQQRFAVILAMVLWANVPDLPLPGWGHSRYRVSHSVFVGIILLACSSMVLRGFQFTRTTMGTWPLIFAGALALFSHYLLDSFYNHRKGIAVLWPFSCARIAIPIPWFTTMKTDPLLCWSNAKVWGIELLCFGTMSGGVLLLCRIYKTFVVNKCSCAFV